MNERIQDLYIQAMHAMKHDPADDIGIQIADKFAQLIVKECAYLVNIQQRTTGYTNHAEMLCKQFNIEFREEDYYENI